MHVRCILKILYGVNHLLYATAVAVAATDVAVIVDVVVHLQDRGPGIHTSRNKGGGEEEEEEEEEGGGTTAAQRFKAIMKLPGD